MMQLASGSMASSEEQQQPKLLRGGRALSTTSDKQLRNLLDHRYHHFNQWKLSRAVSQQSSLTRLRTALDHVLQVLVRGRDYAGAAKALAVVYHRFSLFPAHCVQTSLEIIRKQSSHPKALTEFIKTALQEERLDRLLLLKELFLHYIRQGDFYEAFHLYKDEIQALGVQNDATLLSNFGILCYWILIIECPELRDKYTREPEEEDDDDDNQPAAKPTFNAWLKSDSSGESIEALIESRYLYKPAIGAHILYQEATNALRRAVSLCPSSSVFIEYYVQLMVLGGEIEQACDYLENYFNAYPNEPHAARMFAAFLEFYFTDSTKALVDVYVRWITCDPSSAFALEKILDLASGGSIPSSQLLPILAGAIDECGGDYHLTLHPTLVFALWNRLARELIAVEEEAQSVTSDLDGGLMKGVMQGLSLKRGWWKRVYFSQPSTLEELLQWIRDSPSMAELLAYRTAIAYRMFGNQCQLVKSMRFAVCSQPPVLSRDQLLLVRSLVHLEDFMATELDQSTSDPNTFPHTSKSMLPRILQRKELIKTDRNTNLHIQSSLTESDDRDRLEEALLSALEGEIGEEEEERYSSRKRSFTTMMGATPAHRLPLYVSMVEEAAFKDRDVTVRHLYATIRKALADSPHAAPTIMEIRTTFHFFLNRWASIEWEQRQPCMLLRYESFIANFVRNQMKQGTDVLHPVMLQSLLSAMEQHVPGPFAYFPAREDIAWMMRIKAGGIARMRRRLLRDYAKAMRWLADQNDFVSTRDLVASAWAVCEQNGHDRVLSEADMVRQTELVLWQKYRLVCQRLRPHYRAFLSDPKVRQYTSDPIQVLQIAKRRYPKTSLKLAHVQAHLWLETYALSHPNTIVDEENNS